MSISSHLEGRRGRARFQKAPERPLRPASSTQCQSLWPAIFQRPHWPAEQHRHGTHWIGSFLYLQFLPTKTGLAATIEAGGRAHHMIPAETHRREFTHRTWPSPSRPIVHKQIRCGARPGHATLTSMNEWLIALQARYTSRGWWCSADAKAGSKFPRNFHTHTTHTDRER